MVWDLIGIGAAHAANGAPAQPSIWVQILPLLAILVIFYFLIIRPQTKKMKQHKEMVSNLSAGDEVVTGGGLMGRVVKAQEDALLVQLADNVRVWSQRDSIQTVLPKGTLKD
jgi:preprotein translocase subunit YajC